jgi:hypothetical protein
MLLLLCLSGAGRLKGLVPPLAVRRPIISALALVSNAQTSSTVTKLAIGHQSESNWLSSCNEEYSVQYWNSDVRLGSP